MEIKEINTNELHVGKTIIILSGGNTIEDYVNSTPNEEIAKSEMEAVLRLARKVNRPVNYFVDLSNCRKPSAKARKVYLQLATSPKIGKVAMFGLHPVAQVLASFFIGVVKSRKKDVRFFNSKEMAFKWFAEHQEL